MIDVVYLNIDSGNSNNLRANLTSPQLIDHHFLSGAKKNSPSCRVPALNSSSGITIPSIITVGCQPGLRETPTSVCLGACAPSSGIIASKPVGNVDGRGAPRLPAATQITTSSKAITNNVRVGATPRRRLQLVRPSDSKCSSFCCSSTSLFCPNVLNHQIQRRRMFGE